MRSIPHTPTRVATLAGLLIAASLAGCGVLSGDPEPETAPAPIPATEAPPSPLPSASTAPSTAPSDSASATPGPVDPSASASATPAGPPPSAGPPAGTKKGTIKGDEFTLTVYPVRRTGSLAILDFTVARRPPKPDEEEPKTIDFYEVFDDDDGKTGESFSETSVDGVKLIDSKNRKVYLVASDGRGTCLCSRDISSIQAEPGDVHSFYATFAAPPADVTAVEVSVPRFPTIASVPVQ